MSWVSFLFGLWMCVRNMEKRFNDQNTLIMLLIFSVVLAVPGPFLFGVIRMLKNLLFGLICGAEHRKKQAEKRKWRRERLGIRRRR